MVRRAVQLGGDWQSGARNLRIARARKDVRSTIKWPLSHDLQEKIRRAADVLQHVARRAVDERALDVARRCLRMLLNVQRRDAGSQWRGVRIAVPGGEGGVTLASC